MKNRDFDEVSFLRRLVREAFESVKLMPREIKTIKAPSYYAFEFLLDYERGKTISSVQFHKAMDEYLLIELYSYRGVILRAKNGEPKIRVESSRQHPESINIGIKTIMHSYKEELKDMSLPIVLGVGDNYKPMIIDLAKVGHILVGGATSQGKTNLLHAFAQSIYYSPRKVSEGCFVYYIDPKGVEGPRPYFDFYLTTMEEIRKELEMLCDKIEKRMNDTQLSRYPIMVLIDDLADFVITDKYFMDMLVRIAQRGHWAGVHLVATSIPLSSQVFPGILTANIPTRICFRVVNKYESRLVLDTPDATLLSQQGEMFFSHNGKLTRLQTIKTLE